MKVTDTIDKNGSAARVHGHPSGEACGPGSGRGGFTLVELLITIAIIGILATIALPAYNYILLAAKKSRAEADIRTIDKDIEAYYIDKGTYPPDLNALGRTYIDPWGRSYGYKFPSEMLAEDDFTKLNPLDYDIFSAGPDGVCNANGSDSSSADDIIRSGDGAYVGERY